MAHQSPCIAIPRKTTEEVDWTSPIKTLILQSYGESPDNYSQECATLQRCRQDAVRGAGSDMTARDLLYKYFGQLELLELRFSEIRVNFTWHDAFTNKAITQTSIAYEKASILFQIAATHSAIAAAQNRSDPEGLKRSFYYFRTCAGMLTYINENFLHAPSTDLSREVVKFLVNVILAQSTEVFFEKCTEEKKGNALVSKIGSQAASMYTSISEEVKEFMGKGIFDRNWVTLVQIKAKYFSSLAQYYRAMADSAAGKHGDSLVRYTLAENLAKEASRAAANFASMFVPNLSPTLPADAGPAIHERTKAHLALCTERRGEAQRENDLIYNAILPAPEALPSIEKTNVATPIPIQEVYGNADVQKTIGQDIFIRLVPLSVHESASVYSEEKAKLVRGEVEKADMAEVEVKSVLEGMGVREGLARFRAMAEGEVGGEEEVPVDVRQWKEDIGALESRDGVESLMNQLVRLKDNVSKELDSISRDLEIESKDCEMMRVKYDHQWTQPPSAGLTKSLRQDLKSHLGALEAASTSDQQVSSLWNAVKADIQMLLSPELENVFRASTESGGGSGEHLLDLDVSSDGDDSQERAKIGNYVAEIDERLGRINKIIRERNEVLKDFKEKIQADDVSHLLLLNRRNSNVEPTLFAAELEKFAPYQQRLNATVHLQEVTLQEISGLWKSLKDLAGRGPGARKWEEREKKKRDTILRFSKARDDYMEIRDGIAKGLQFYKELTDLTTKLKSNVRTYVSGRTVEREGLSSRLESERRSSTVSSPPPLAPKPPRPPPPSSTPLDSQFNSMNLQGGPPGGPTSPPPLQSWQSQAPPPSSYSSPPPLPGQYNQSSNSMQFSSPPPQQSVPQSYNHASQSRTSWLPPPPPNASSNPSAPPSDPYASLGMFSPPSQNAYQGSNLNTSPPPQPSYNNPSYPSPPPSQPQSHFPPPPAQQQYSYHAQPHQQPPPPPPAPPQQQQQYGFPPPPNQHPSYPPPQQHQNYQYTPQYR